MNLPRRRIVQLCVGSAAVGVAVLVGAVVVILLLEAMVGGPHETIRGKAYGFEIGMSKSNVFQTFKELKETANIRAIGRDGGEHLSDALDPVELVFIGEFQESDHWVGYRKRFPIWYQEFYFANGRLVKLVTYIRFYEGF